MNPLQNFSLNLKFKWTITAQYNLEEFFFCWDAMDSTLVRDIDLFFMDLKNSTYMFQAQHIKYRKDTLSRTKVFSWWIRCYFSPIISAALTQFNIFTGLKCFSKPVTDAIFSKTSTFNRRIESLPLPTLQMAKQINYSNL